LFYLGAQRKYVAFIFPLALRRHCRFLYLTVVFGNTGTCSVAIVSFGPQKAQLLAEITLLPVINFWNLAYIWRTPKTHLNLFRLSRILFCIFWHLLPFPVNFCWHWQELLTLSLWKHADVYGLKVGNDFGCQYEFMQINLKWR